MKLLQLALSDFRNYRSREFSFEKPTTVLLGPNAQGKTNVLEAIYMLSTGDSFRAGKIEEMVHFEAEVGHVTGRVRQSNGEDVDLRITVTRGMVQGKKVAKRRYFVNGVGRRKKDVVQELTSVLFLPDHLRLIDGSPSRRRGFMDEVLVQAVTGYDRSLSAYEKALRRRNKLLDLLREGEVERSSLYFWDKVLLKEGVALQEERQRLFDYLNREADAKGYGIAVEYDPSVMSQARLKKYSSREVAAGYTLIGPHKDDFIVIDQGVLGEMEDVSSRRNRDLAVYGSRGEQRMAVLQLKLLQLSFIEEETERRPLLLLDDIFSELDEAHEQVVLELLGKQQTIITATEVEPTWKKMLGVEVVEV